MKNDAIEIAKNGTGTAENIAIEKRTVTVSTATGIKKAVNIGKRKAAADHAGRGAIAKIAKETRRRIKNGRKIRVNIKRKRLEFNFF